jgi:hypothetical protein
VKRAITFIIAGVVMILMLTGASGKSCENDGPGTPSYNARHHINETPQPDMPNPDPDPNRRGPGRPPGGKSVTFTVTAAKGMETIVVTYTIGGRRESFHMTGTKHWGTFADVGTPVSVLAAPEKPTKTDGTFKHGQIRVLVRREPATAAEGGPVICQDANGVDNNATGGAQCAGNV